MKICFEHKSNIVFDEIDTLFVLFSVFQHYLSTFFIIFVADKIIYAKWFVARYVSLL